MVPMVTHIFCPVASVSDGGCNDLQMQPRVTSVGKP